MRSTLLLLLLLFFTSLLQAQNTSHYRADQVIVKFKQVPEQKSKQALLSASTLNKTGNISLSQRFTAKSQSPINRNRQKKGTQRTINPDLYYVVNLPENLDVSKSIQYLMQDPNVDYAEPIYTHFESLLEEPPFIPNDPGADENSNLYQYHLSKIQAYDAWGIETGNADTKIGIVELYFYDLEHEDLMDNLAPGAYDFGDEDEDVNPSDGFPVNPDNSAQKHATSIASCIAATPNNGIGLVGTAYHCPYIPVQFVSLADGSADPYQAVEYLAQQGVKVINMSWGRVSGCAAGPYSQFENDFFNYIVEEYDVVLVAAAGNCNLEMDVYPAAYDIVLSVTSTNINDQRGDAYSTTVDLCAPGRSIRTAKPGGYTVVNGTSSASAITSGAIALVRAHFPELNAYQTIERIKATADASIYEIPENIAYAGKIGSGRLNLYRALTENNLKSMQLLNHQWESNILPMANQDISIHCLLSNLLSDMSNLEVTLSSTSPHIVISNEQQVIGALNGNNTSLNLSFNIHIDEATPVNTSADFTLTLTDGDFTQVLAFSKVINPDYYFLNANQLGLDLGNNGNLALFSFFSDRKGLQYTPSHAALLYNAGLLIGTDENHMSENANLYVNNQIIINQPFTKIADFEIDNDQENYESVISHYNDLDHEEGVGIAVTQKTMAWNEEGLENTILLEYDIKNKNENAIEDVHIGIFTDWEVHRFTNQLWGKAVNNKASWDEELKLGYSYQENGLYAGICLLTSQVPQYFAFNILPVPGENDININDGFTAAEKWQSISSGTNFTQAGGQNGNDVASSIAAVIDNLNSEENETVAFAILVGENLESLKEQAENAFRKYHTSPEPVINNNYEVCAGDTLTISPQNGDLFRFYGDQNMENLLFEGATYILNSIQEESTLYITNIDKPIESDPVTVNITFKEEGCAPPPPDLDHFFSVCLGDTLTISPQNGALFRFYEDENLNELLLEGISLVLPNIRASRTIYITSINNEFESSAITVPINMKEEGCPIPKLRFYPNPSKGNIKFNSYGFPFDEADLYVYNMYGLKVATKKIQGLENKEFDITLTLPSGIYLFTINHDGFVYHKQIMILKD